MRTNEHKLTVDNSTFATLRGNIEVDLVHYMNEHPKDSAIIIAVLALTIIATLMLSWVCIIGVVAVIGVSLYKMITIREHFKFGDVNPGIVVTEHPFRVAVFGDLSKGARPHPVIKVVRYKSSDSRFRIGDRVSTVALYREIANIKEPWADFFPKMTHCATRDRKAVERTLCRIRKWQWQALEEGIVQLPLPIRSGLYEVDIQSVDLGYENYVASLMGLENYDETLSDRIIAIQKRKDSDNFLPEHLRLDWFLETGRRQRLAGMSLLVIAFFLFVSRNVIKSLLFSEYGITKTLINLFCAILVALGTYLLNSGRKHRSPNIQELEKVDSRPPVLYLRPFEDDSEASETGSMSGLSMSSIFAVATEEEQMKMALESIGPLVAIGRPGEKLPELGAVRMYVDSGNSWEETVVDLMSRCRLVVLRAGETSGFLWEFQEMIKRMDPCKVLIIIPRNSKKYRSFRDITEKYLPSALPRDFYGKGVRGFFNRMLCHAGNMAGFICFDSDWNPRIMKIRRVLLTRSITAPLVGPLQATLRPIFSRFDVKEDVSSPKNSKILLLAVVVFLVALVVGLFS